MILHVPNADVIVVGLGAMGSAVSYQLARRGAQVIGIDRFAPPHAFGSTHGQTRLTRQATGEGIASAQLVLRSHGLWREIEQETGNELFVQCGGLILTAASNNEGTHGTKNFHTATVDVASALDIEHEVFDGNEVDHRFPQFRLEEEHRCYYEPGAGFVYPEAAVRSQLELASRHGAVLRYDERVLEVTPSEHGVVVRTDQGTYGAAQIVLAAGAWLPGLLPTQPDLRKLFTIVRQVLLWFDVAHERNRTDFIPGRFPVCIWTHGAGATDVFYGFPLADTSDTAIKVASEQYAESTRADELNREVSDSEAQAMFDTHVRGRIPALTSKAGRRAACMYTVTPDYGFVIDRHPNHENVVLLSACSGHGFKASAAIGEAVAQLVLDGFSRLDLSPFSLGRFAA